MRAIRRVMAFALLPAVLSVTPASAQWWTALSYQPAVPMGNTQEFTDGFARHGPVLVANTLTRGYFDSLRQERGLKGIRGSRYQNQDVEQRQ